MKLRWVERKIEIPLNDTLYGIFHARMEKVRVLQYWDEPNDGFANGKWIDVHLEVEANHEK